MALRRIPMTKIQRKYINNIESDLNVIFDAKNTRKDADEFIKKHLKQHRLFVKEHNIIPPPTGKQQRLIKKIEDVLDIKYYGKSVKTASKFIEEYLLEYKYETDIETIY